MAQMGWGQMNPALGDRSKYVGCSDLAAILGVSPWQSQAEVWATKKQILDPIDLSRIEKIQWGTRLQRPILDESIKRLEGREIKPKSGEEIELVHPQIDFFRGHLDCLIQLPTGEFVIVDAKNSERDFQYSDGIPIHYRLQLMGYMGLARLADIPVSKSYLAVLIAGCRLELMELEFDPEEFQAIEDAVRIFWASLANDEPPDWAGADRALIRKIRGVDPDTIMVADPGLTELIRKQQAVKAERLLAEKHYGKLQDEADRDVELAAKTFELLEVPDLGLEVFRGVQTRKAYEIPDEVKAQYQVEKEIQIMTVRKLRRKLEDV
jgi:predicted phage-related endonuclease